MPDVGVQNRAMHSLMLKSYITVLRDSTRQFSESFALHAKIASVIVKFIVKCIHNASHFGWHYSRLFHKPVLICAKITVAGRSEVLPGLCGVQKRGQHEQKEPHARSSHLFILLQFGKNSRERTIKKTSRNKCHKILQFFFLKIECIERVAGPQCALCAIFILSDPRIKSTQIR